MASRPWAIALAHGRILGRPEERRWAWPGQLHLRRGCRMIGIARRRISGGGIAGHSESSEQPSFSSSQDRPPLDCFAAVPLRSTPTAQNLPSPPRLAAKQVLKSRTQENSLFADGNKSCLSCPPSSIRDGVS